MSLRASLKAEFLKLFTVRSTYILVILSLIFVVLYAFFFEGYKGNTGSAAANLQPTALQEILTNGAGLAVIFASLVAILFVSHEYRYNTIMYTLTDNAKRSSVLLSKIISIVIFGAGYGLLVMGIAIGSYMAGLSLRDASLPAQDFEILSALGKVAFYYTGYALFGLFIALIARNIVAAIATLLIFSTTIEPLIAQFVLKENGKFMPFTALDSTLGASIVENTLTPLSAIGVTCFYLIVGLVISFLLFIRRDAN